MSFIFFSLVETTKLFQTHNYLLNLARNSLIKKINYHLISYNFCLKEIFFSICTETDMTNPLFSTASFSAAYKLLSELKKKKFSFFPESLPQQSE